MDLERRLLKHLMVEHAAEANVLFLSLMGSRGEIIGLPHSQCHQQRRELLLPFLMALWWLYVTANILSISTAFSPVLSMIPIIREKSVGTFLDWPYWIAFVSNLLWVSYGTKWVAPSYRLGIGSNAVSSTMSLIYIILYIVYCKGEQFRKLRCRVITMGLLGAIAVVTLSVATIKSTTSSRTRKTVMGSFAAVVNCMLYAIPIIQLYTGSLNAWEIPWVFVSMMRAISWTLYAALAQKKRDLILLIPNAVGTFVCAIELIWLVLKCIQKRLVQGSQESRTLEGSAMENK